MLVAKNVTKEGVESMNLFSYEFLNHRRIRLTGPIDEITADKVIAAIQYLDNINHRDIEVVINSPGGTISAGLAIYDAMKEAVSDIRTVCSGEAASMGALLMACGGTKGKREIYPSAEMMLHQPLGGVSGQATDLQLTAIHITKIKKKLVALLAEATGNTAKTINQDIDRDLWLNAEEALAYGLVDKIR